MRWSVFAIFAAVGFATLGCGRPDGRPAKLVAADLRGSYYVGGHDRVSFYGDVPATGECLSLGLVATGTDKEWPGLELPQDWELARLGIRPAPCAEPSEERIAPIPVTGFVRFDEGGKTFPPPAMVDLEFGRGRDADPPSVWMAGRVEVYE